MSKQTPLTREQFAALIDAIDDAIPSNDELELLVELKLGQRLNAITKEGQHKWMVMKVVDWAKARGSKLDDLIAGALNQNPDNLQLLAVAQQLGLDEGAAEFEAFVLESAPATDVEVFHAQMRTCERAVCRVEGPKYGSGFLVGPGLVVTNYHVVDTIINGVASPSAVSIRFDYKMKADGKTLQNGVEYKLQAGSRWLAASSTRDALDYALLRVAGNPERGSVGSQPGAPVREHLIPKAHTFSEGDPLFIIQHPEKNPQKFAVGVVNNTDLSKHHVYYKVNTEHGSSGAPCFDAEWQLVALHHWGSETKKLNRGVIFSEILEDWKKNEQLLKELGY
jgi:V8-like Glu-specific endopeptidase